MNIDYHYQDPESWMQVFKREELVTIERSLSIAENEMGGSFRSDCETLRARVCRAIEALDAADEEANRVLSGYKAICVGDHTPEELIGMICGDTETGRPALVLEEIFVLHRLGTNDYILDIESGSVVTNPRVAQSWSSRSKAQHALVDSKLNSDGKSWWVIEEVTDDS